MNASSSILCFHFDHNLKDSHESTLWIILITLRLSRAVGFMTTVTYIFFSQWSGAKVRAQEVGQASCRK